MAPRSAPAIATAISWCTDAVRTGGVAVASPPVLAGFVSAAADVAGSRVAGHGPVRRGRIRAQRPEGGLRVGPGDERQGPRLVIAVERRHPGEPAGCRVGRIVEPETEVERVRRTESYGRVEAEDLVEQDCLDPHGRSAGVADVDVRLVPGKTEVGEPGNGRAVGVLVAVLHREQGELQARLKVAQPQRRGV